MKTRINSTALFLITCLFLSACGISKDAVSTQVAANIQASQTALAIDHPATSTPSSTNTSTPVPTSTSTSTPNPTPTLTSTPAPIVINTGNAPQLLLVDSLTGFENVEGIILSPEGISAMQISADYKVQETLVQPNVSTSEFSPETWTFASDAFSQDATMCISETKELNGFGLNVMKVGENLNLVPLARNISGYTLSGFSSGFSDDGRYLVSISHEQKVWQFPKDPSACSPHCTVTFTYKPIKGSIYQLPSVQSVSALDIYTPEMNYIKNRFSPGNNYLATLSLTGRIPGPPWLFVQIWQVSDGSLYRKLDAIPAENGIISDMDFSPDRSDLAFFAGKNLQIWEWEPNTIRWTVEGNFSAIDYSPDGSIIATGMLDGSIQVYATSDGKLIATLQGHEHPITAVSFSPDGTLLVSLDEDGILKIWDIPR